MSKMKELHYDLTVAAEEDTQLGAAARYLLNGWSVMPLKARSKEPHFDLIKKAYLSATTDWELIQFWFQCDPKANIGIACTVTLLLDQEIPHKIQADIYEPNVTQ